MTPSRSLPHIADPVAWALAGDATATGDWALPLVVVGSAGALALYAYAKRRRRITTRTTPHGGSPEPPGTPLPEVDAEAKLLLVQTDDAVRTSAGELRFARAQLGGAAVKPYAEAVAYAEEELAAAFRLRQELDDGLPQGETPRRRVLEAIISRCTEAHRHLDSEAPGFDGLRDREGTAAEGLGHAESVFREVTARIGTSEATLRALAGRYADAASAPVARFVEAAKERLVFATAQLNTARHAVDAGDNAAAAVRIRAAEGAVDQAGTLVDAVDRLAQELAEAAGKLPEAISLTEADLADAGRSAGAAEGLMVRARTVVGDVRDEMDLGRYDPLDALRRVGAADAALDEMLARTREPGSAGQRIHTLLDLAMLTARSGVGVAEDYLGTHRGAIGSRARTRLAAAHRHLAQAESQAESQAGSDPADALAEAVRADDLSLQARQLSEHDVAAYDDGLHHDQDLGLDSAILGGILLPPEATARTADAPFGGAVPGSFGGAETRGRR